jgi:hypothetical protein
MTAEIRLAAISGAIGFLAGALVVSVMGIVWERRNNPSEVVVPSPETAVVEGAPMSQVIRPPDVAPSPRLYLEAVADLRARRLDVPVFGTRRDLLRPMFDEQRSGDRTHEAIDILAPTGTPVVAVEDGIIAKLFLSEAGGITIYQFDPTNRYAYYYAHLDAYAPGLTDRAAVTRGQTIGYVGTSGNAPKNTPHLHFAIYELTDEKRWWQGTPIDPFLVLK